MKTLFVIVSDNLPRSSAYTLANIYAERKTRTWEGDREPDTIFHRKILEMNNLATPRQKIYFNGISEIEKSSRVLWSIVCSIYIVFINTIRINTYAILNIMTR